MVEKRKCSTFDHKFHFRCHFAQDRIHLEDRCRKSLENHVSFVTRTLRQDSSSSSSAVFPPIGRGDGAYTPEDSDFDSGDDEKTIVEAEKADGLFQGWGFCPRRPFLLICN